MELPTTQELIEAIDAFIERHGMRPSRFGRDATGEPQLLDSLRRGRSPSLDTANRIAGFMVSYDAKVAAAAHAASDTVAARQPSPGNDKAFSPSVQHG
jgi:hypothetical protein